MKNDIRVDRFLKRLFRFLTETKIRRIVSVLLLLIVILSVMSIFYFASFDKEILNSNSYSSTFYDCTGKPLRTFFSSQETYSTPCGLTEISPHFLRAIVLVEDKHYYDHHGVVLSSLFRALWQNIRGRRIVSGGSTITMQTTKLLYKHRKRTLFNKVSEIFAAIKFEFHLSKSEILKTYINRLPFGNMMYGIKQAAKFYFDKEPSQLSLNQAIYLALIPKSPSRYNPATHQKILKKRWKTILKIFKQHNHITGDEFQRAQSEGIHFNMDRQPFLAPHFISVVKEKYKDKTLPEKIHTTLNYSIQKKMIGIVREHLERLKHYDVSSTAAIVIDNSSHQVIGFIGAPDYFNLETAGKVNLATALRQPGSTLKPFVYGLALETGFTTASIVPDIKFPSKGGFFPKNHDGREHGPLRIRRALACSYNIPAFYLAMKLTPAKVIQVLNNAGFTSLQSKSGFYGETIALGSGEVRLLDLVTAYSAFANKGWVFQPTFIQNEPQHKTKLFDEATAFLIWDILADPSARAASFGYNSSMNLPFPVAIKTGTSKGYRDKWAIGVNSRFTVGVWIGNPDGKNMKDTSNTGSAATILRDIFLAIQKDWTTGAIDTPKDILKDSVCVLSGELASEFCPNTIDEYFYIKQRPKQICTWHNYYNGQVKIRYPELYRKWAMKNIPNEILDFEQETRKRISFPQQGDFFYLSNAIARGDQQITFEAMGFQAGKLIEYYLNGKLYQRKFFPEFPVWQLQKGNYQLSIRVNNKIIDSLSFIVR
jgi:penicillin-binding protein 1C